MVVRRSFLLAANAHWSPALDWCCAASERWYIACVISLDDNPAKAVASTVRTMGVVVRMVPQMPLGTGGLSTLAGSFVSLTSIEQPPRDFGRRGDGTDRTS